MNEFRMDVARWFVPGQIGDVRHVTLKRMLVLLYRHAGLRAMLVFRLGSWLRSRGVRGATHAATRLLHRRYGIEMLVGAPVGGGLYIAHTVGTVISPAQIGENCSIIASVTIGMRNEHAFPTLGDRVFLGAGSRVLGEISLGDDVSVGANAVVIHDVPPATAVVGIPARPRDGARHEPSRSG